MVARDTDLDRRIEGVRRFNRFYTQQIGVLDEGLLESAFSLTEVRVLYELAHREVSTAGELGADLGLDAGYLSRILGGFVRGGLLARKPSRTDGRQTLLRLTAKGTGAFGPLDVRAREAIRAMLGGLSATEQRRLLDAMTRIEGLLGARPAPSPAYVLRQHRPGDMGWIVHRHGVLYAEEYGWNERCEGLAAGIVAKFIDKHDPKRERCWIADRGGAIVGSVFVVEDSKTVAKLRLLFVEAEARGLGIGARLVDECVRFARKAGYGKIALWTNDVLHSARRIYEAAGFRLVEEKRHRTFGPSLVGQTWELGLHRRRLARRRNPRGGSGKTR